MIEYEERGPWQLRQEVVLKKINFSKKSLKSGYKWENFDDPSSRHIALGIMSRDDSYG